MILIKPGIFKNRLIRESDNLSDKIDCIKNGDIELRNTFIEEYRPFILSCISKRTNSFIEVDNSEEYSIGLMAFNEAIETYDKTKNPRFLSFAELVIGRRLINYMYKQKRQARAIPFSFFSEKEGYLEDKIAQDSITFYFDRFEAREEIELFINRLKRFEITLEDLIKNTPKHKDSIKLLISIARVIAENDELFQKLEDDMVIPIKKLLSYIKVSARTIERNRKYIIAASLALRSDLDIIKGFLNGM